MLTVAYLANQFPCAVEPYVSREIEELRRRGIRVIAGSARKPSMKPGAAATNCVPEIVLQPLQSMIILRALGLCVWRWKRISGLMSRVLFHGSEGPVRRLKALLHTLLGACYAAILQGREVEHIHVHHGYFGSWIGMVAARLLNVGFSMTLHGSDLLLHAVYLDVKLDRCTFCLTVSEFNRRHILDRHPEIQPGKVVVSRLGVELSDRLGSDLGQTPGADGFSILTVGRLHAVKDHAFLLRACAQLQVRGIRFECSIAGDGPERHNLESLIRKYGLEDRVTLLGHVPHEQIDSLFSRADLVVLTSRSEGVPLVLMEAMARGRVVLAPAITGIPELVIAGKTGFLYESGSLGDFLAKILFVHSLLVDRNHRRLDPDILLAARPLDRVRHAAEVQVRHNFNGSRNLETFGDLFLERIAPQTENVPHASLVLQQI